METFWAIVILATSQAVGPMLAVLLQEIIIRAKQAPRRNELKQKTAQTQDVKRVRYRRLLFPPDPRHLVVRIVFLVLTAGLAFVLVTQARSNEPITRYSVVTLAALIGALVIIVLLDAFSSVLVIISLRLWEIRAEITSKGARRKPTIID